MPRHVSDTWQDYFGPGALPSFSLAVTTALLGAGLPVAHRLLEVVRGGRRGASRPADAIVVLGRALRNDQVSAAFRSRLEHARRLFSQGLAPRILVAGGLTARSTRSEAAAGREVLLAAGVPADVVLCEERSRHTLENLAFARDLLRGVGAARILLVSDRYHLARALAYARGLGLDVEGSAAPYPAAPPRHALRALREAFFLHWYHVGVAWSRAIGARELIARVT